MPYSEFTLESAMSILEVTTRECDLFPALIPAAVPSWLTDSLQRGTRLALNSEKSRSEFIVAPILLAARELSSGRLAIFSGQRLDIDPARGLAGECDFIIAVGPSLPPLRSPLMAVVEAKKHDIDAGLGQCIAQMIAARTFNEMSGIMGRPTFGCVTTGEDWQFLKLVDSVVEFDNRRFFFDNLAGILGSIMAILKETEAIKSNPI